VLNGDYCSFHNKNPRPFIKAIDLSVLSRKNKARLERFISLCKFKTGLLQSKRQGYATTYPALANNSTELASMDEVSTIPVPFRFSFVEAKNIWLFDVRSLLQERKRVEDHPFHNPYTSLPISPAILLKLESHIEWLLSRRYSLDSGTTTELGQLHQQKIVELCFFIDSHGYLTNVAWFQLPSVALVHKFIDTLDTLWTTRLGLTNATKLLIYPEWDVETHNLCPLIRSNNLTSALNQLFTHLLVFVRAAELKENRALAAVYILTALTHVSTGAKKAFPWLHAM
jgi:hypothetical protein